MGNFLQSVHLRFTDEAAADAALTAICRGTKLRLWVSPVRNGWLTVFPNRFEGFMHVCRHASRTLGCTAVGTMVHDSDVFCYSVCVDGREDDEFASTPEYFRQASKAERLRAAGNPEKIRHLLAVPDGWERLLRLYAQRLVLDPENQMHEMLVLLGIPDGLSSYEHLEAGERSGVSDWSRYRHIPDLAAEKEANRKQQADIKAQKIQLRKDGLLVDEIKFEAFKGQQFFPFAGDPATGGFLTRHRDIVHRWLPPAVPSPAPELNGHQLAAQARGESLLTEDRQLTIQYRRVLCHPRKPYLVCLGATLVGLADTRSGKLSRQLLAQNPLMVPKKTAQWRSQGIEPQPFFDLARDDVICGAFSPDGEFVFFGTSEGLRIHRYADIIAAEKTLPLPLQSHETSVRLQDHRGVKSMVVDASSQRILYTGFDEAIWSYHWPSGTNSPLTPALGNFWGFALQVSGNGELLACSLRGELEDARQKDKYLVRVWHLPRLLAAATQAGL